jgi:beta-barrel assembly-enhancing protease
MRRINHARRMVCGLAACLCSVSLCRAQQSAPERPSFTFTKVDVEMLDKSNQLDRQFQEKGLVYNDRATTKYVETVGEAVLPEGPAPENVEWKFFALRNPEPNAFALPNGSIYVHTGLLALLENEAQLAGILAHEETHVLNRHGYLENRSYRKKMMAANILAGVASMGSYAGGAAGGASVLMGTALPSILLATMNGYSRELEREADLRAVHAMVDADYSAEEMAIVFKLLQQSHEVELSQTYYQDHPKLQDRAAYVSELGNSLHSRSAHPKVEADRYLLESESAVRHDVDLEIRAGRARTAAWVMEHVVKRDNKLAENFYALGESYRALGPHTPEPAPGELTSQGKGETRKMLSKMTPQEYEEALLKTPEGQAAWKANQEKAREAYQKAIELSPAYAAPHRGLGFLYERAHQPELSVQEFRRYLELAPAALDEPQIKRRIEQMEKESPSPSAPSMPH